MILDECIEIGKECGLTDLRECFNNIDIHSTMLFKYEEINKELNDLIDDIEQKYSIGHLASPEFFEYLQNIKIEGYA